MTADFGTLERVVFAVYATLEVMLVQGLLLVPVRCDDGLEKRV
jgi:hypothetical protein